MNLVLHTFKKDTRHLWPAVAISLALLALLARADRWRADSIIGSSEGWLNLLLPVAWACLVALAVLEEPLSGDRHFWLTRPHCWTTLLCAKLLFALLFVHLPCLLADLYIVLAHGFSVFECLPQLLLKQLMLAATITLPSLAIAALAGSFAHFALLLFLVAAGAIFATGGPFRILPTTDRPQDYLRGEFAAPLVALAAIAIVVLRYRRRRVALARTLAIATALLTGTLFGYVPESFDYRLRAALHPAATPTLAIEPHPQTGLTRNMASRGRATIVIPLAISGISPNALYHIGPVELTITAANGSRFRNTPITPETQYGSVEVFARVEPASLSLLLQLQPGIYQKLQNQSVRVAGHLPITFYRLGATGSMPLHGEVIVPGVGHCSNSVTDTDGRVKVLCESPALLPQTVHVNLAIPGQDHEWNSRLGDLANLAGGPRWAWLSPLDRGKTFFPTSDPSTRRYNYYMEVPQEHLDKARISLMPEIPTAYSVINFDFPAVTLSTYYLVPAR